MPCLSFKGIAGFASVDGGFEVPLWWFRTINHIEDEAASILTIRKTRTCKHNETEKASGHLINDCNVVLSTCQRLQTLHMPNFQRGVSVVLYVFSKIMMQIARTPLLIQAPSFHSQGSSTFFPLARPMQNMMNAIDPSTLLASVSAQVSLIICKCLKTTTWSIGKGCNALYLHHLMNLNIGFALECSVAVLFVVIDGSRASINKIWEADCIANAIQPGWISIHQQWQVKAISSKLLHAMHQVCHARSYLEIISSTWCLQICRLHLAFQLQTARRSPSYLQVPVVGEFKMLPLDPGTNKWHRLMCKQTSIPWLL